MPGKARVVAGSLCLALIGLVNVASWAQTHYFPESPIEVVVPSRARPAWPKR